MMGNNCEQWQLMFTVRSDSACYEFCCHCHATELRLH